MSNVSQVWTVTGEVKASEIDGPLPVCFLLWSFRGWRMAGCSGPIVQGKTLEGWLGKCRTPFPFFLCHLSLIVCRFLSLLQCVFKQSVYNLLRTVRTQKGEMSYIYTRFGRKV